MKHNIFYYLTNLRATFHSVRMKVSDKFTIEEQWKANRGYALDWHNLKTLSEKMQWLKLYDHKPLYTTLVDKVEAKKWFEKKFGIHALIPTYGVYKNADEIDFSALPKSFVLKCNHDSGTVFICYDKQSGLIYDKHRKPHDFNSVKSQLNEALKKNFYYRFREWAYKNVEPRIICEKLIQCKNGTIPNDYKLFYINGEFQFAYVAYGRESVNDRCMFDKDWNRMPFIWCETYVYHKGINTAQVEKPQSFEEMMACGAEIAKEFKCVRVDFYDVDGKMYFGEITPFHCGGFAQFYPEEYDLEYGRKLNLN